MVKRKRKQIPGKNFIQEFNKNKVSTEFLESCKKAGKLFKLRSNAE